MHLVLCSANSIAQESNDRDAIYIGPCTWILDRKCPDKDIKFWLHTQSNPVDRQLVHIDETWENSNLSTSFFDPQFPVKIIIHGECRQSNALPLIDSL